MSASPDTRAAVAHFVGLREWHARTSRRLHVAGAVLALVIPAAALVSARWLVPPVAPLGGYLHARSGRLLSAGNSRATLRHPLCGLPAHVRLLAEVLTARVRC